MTARARRSPVSVGDLILVSKVTVPGVPDWAVPRPRITKMIAEGMRRCPLTVVTGPAGAGKTMALALWAATEPGPVAWVGLDGYDNRPRVFWPYVVAALGEAGVSAAKTLPTVVRGRTGADVFLLRLASALAAQDPPVTLVLDDLHLLADPTVLDGLDYVLRNAGPGCAWWSRRGWTRCRCCRATASLASWPKSGPTTWRSASPRSDRS